MRTLYGHALWANTSDLCETVFGKNQAPWWKWWASAIKIVYSMLWPRQYLLPISFRHDSPLLRATQYPSYMASILLPINIQFVLIVLTDMDIIGGYNFCGHQLVELLILTFWFLKALGILFYFKGCYLLSVSTPNLIDRLMIK